MSNYWLIKTLLLLALLATMWLIIRPVHTQRSLALRRLAMMLIVIFAIFAVLFPGILNRLATLVGVEKGINLLVYVLVLALFAQSAAAYRRDSDAEKRLTLMARAIALSNAVQPASSLTPAQGELQTDSRASGLTNQSDATAQPRSDE